MSSLLLPIVILAGGLATRLRPLTMTMPKSLILIKQEPFIAHQLRLLQKNGFKKVIICTGFLGEQIIDFAGDGSEFDLTITYVNDGPQLLGTAGAIKKAFPHLENEFFVIYGDSYLLCDYAAAQHAFLQSNKSALMTVYHNQGKWDSSNVEYVNQQILVYDKVHKTPNMQYIDYGLGLFKKDAFESVPDNEKYDLADLYQSLLSKGELAAFEVHQRFYETGSLTGIKELEHYLYSEEINS